MTLAQSNARPAAAGRLSWHAPLAATVLTALTALMALTGCATSPQHLALISAGHTGCAVSDNQVSEVQTHLAGVTWVSTCQGQRWRCSAVAASDQGLSGSCAPAR